MKCACSLGVVKIPSAKALSVPGGGTTRAGVSDWVCAGSEAATHVVADYPKDLARVTAGRVDGLRSAQAVANQASGAQEGTKNNNTALDTWQNIGEYTSAI